MNKEQERILQMLADGTINAEEAEDILSALGDDEGAEVASGEIISTPDIQEAKPHTPPPDLSRFKRWWRVPLFIALGSAILSGAGLILMYQSTKQIALLGFLCIWSLFIIALLASVLLLMVRRTTWMYIKVDEKNGSRFAFAIPMPLGLVDWSVKVARPFVSPKQAGHLETVSAFVATMKDDPDATPIVIDVDEEDGDTVQVYIG